MPPGPPSRPIAATGHDHGPILLWAAVGQCVVCRAPIYEVYDSSLPLDHYLQPLKTWVGTSAACNHAHGAPDAPQVIADYRRTKEGRV